MFVRRDSFGSCGIGRVEAVVLTERFFVFLIFLFGESARLRPGSVENGLAGELALSGVLVVASELVLKDLKDDMGSIDIADSGEELGDGSVAESMVETVVVGEDSADSNVEAESLRDSCDEILEL